MEAIEDRSRMYSLEIFPYCPKYSFVLRIDMDWGSAGRPAGNQVLGADLVGSCCWKLHPDDINHILHYHPDTQQMPPTHGCQLLYRLCPLCFLLFCPLDPGSSAFNTQEKESSLLFKVDRLEYDGFGIIGPTTSWTTRICSEEFVIAELTDLVVSSCARGDGDHKLT